MFDNGEYRWHADPRPRSTVLMQSSYRTKLTIKKSAGDKPPGRAKSRSLRPPRLTHAIARQGM